MIIYNVTVNIDSDVHQDWFDWMSDVHIKDVMDTGLFLEARFSRILAEEEGGMSYSIQYLCKDMETLEKYQQEHAPKLQLDHHKRYEGKFVAFRTLLRVDKTF
ncbi:DUF4286 family protein [Paracrocinitomix mangrovi]|uniref:DUF4286 family protein n=1 Tax=Paracrocinitomix mangrovi TaxID=2862509 RepID=UPI001C8EE656|nr:DUF4286 family protein [Paracrocinitomix mangrovi]UKN03434.1 DUF4286 family protein [Paracrocinitomix mangrovi]